MDNTNSKRNTQATILLIGSFLGMTADATAQQEKQLEDVVVSASRSEQKRFDAPASIDAIQIDPLRAASPLVNLSELLGTAPGIQVRERQNYAQDLQLSVRGFGTRSTFGVRGVRILVDGIPATMPDGQGQAATASLSSAQRVEVLRGPAAQLYGNSAGGVVQIFTKEPPRGLELGAQAGAGSDNQRLFGASIGGGTDTVAALLDVTNYRTDGYRDHSAAERTQVNGKAVVNAAPGTRATILFSHFDQPESQDPLGLSRASFEANPRAVHPNAIRFNTRKSIDQTQGGIVLEQTVFGNDTITARAYTGRRDVNQKLAFQTNGVVDLDRTYGGVGLMYTHNTRIAGLPAQLIAGFDADRMREIRKGFDNNFGTEGELRRDENNTVSNRDFYAQGSWQVAPTWRVVAGLRASKVEFEVDDRFNPPARSTSGSVSYDHTSPVVGVVWHASDVLNIYANLGTGFETPTFVEVANSPGNAPGPNLNLEASKSVQGEVGAKLRLARHSLDTAIFYARSRNEIVPTAEGGRATFQNADRAHRAGVEAAWRAEWGTLQSKLAYTYLDAEFDSAYNTRRGTVASGNRLPGVAEHSLYAEVEARLSERARAGVEWRSESSFFADDTNTESAPGYGIINLRGDYSFRAMGTKLFLFARLDNIFDKQYAGSVIVNDVNGRFYEAAPGRRLFAGIRAQY